MLIQLNLVRIVVIIITFERHRVHLVKFVVGVKIGHGLSFLSTSKK